MVTIKFSKELLTRNCSLINLISLKNNKGNAPLLITKL